MDTHIDISTWHRIDFTDLKYDDADLTMYLTWLEERTHCPELNHCLIAVDHLTVMCVDLKHVNLSVIDGLWLWAFTETGFRFVIEKRDIAVEFKLIFAS